VRIDFSDFKHLEYGQVDPRSFSIGSNAIHELRHLSTHLRDPRGSTTEVGPVVGFVNKIRSEQGLPTRGPGYSGSRYGFLGQKIGINFLGVNSNRPQEACYVYFPAKLLSE
jgi:hypothetical protein